MKLCQFQLKSFNSTKISLLCFQRRHCFHCAPLFTSQWKGKSNRKSAPRPGHQCGKFSNTLLKPGERIKRCVQNKDPKYSISQHPMDPCTNQPYSKSCCLHFPIVNDIYSFNSHYAYIILCIIQNQKNIRDLLRHLRAEIKNHNLESEDCKELLKKYIFETFIITEAENEVLTVYFSPVDSLNYDSAGSQSSASGSPATDSPVITLPNINLFPTPKSNAFTKGKRKTPEEGFDDQQQQPKKSKSSSDVLMTDTTKVNSIYLFKSGCE